MEVKKFLSHLIEVSNLLKVDEGVSNEMLKKILINRIVYQVTEQMTIGINK